MCINTSDERNCPRDRLALGSYTHIPAPAIINFDGRGGYSMQTLNTPKTSLNDSSPQCPETHFQCPNDGYCLPVFVRCNGVYDCPEKEDEFECENPDCAGYYRCRGFPVCLHPDHVCDGTVQCPQHDDELWCGLVCPHTCVCLGLTLKCFNTSDIKDIPKHVRALDMSDTNKVVSQLEDFPLLIYLDISHCHLKYVMLNPFLNLQTLNLSKNIITSIQAKDLASLPNLRNLFLSQNPIESLFPEDIKEQVSLPSLKHIDLSNVVILHIDASVFNSFPNLRHLNLSQSGIKQVWTSRSLSLSKLQILDLSGCAISEFPSDLFRNLDELTWMKSDNYKLCCPQVLPSGFNPRNCHAPINEISSCTNLLRSHTYRVFLALFAIFALAGNVISLMIRLCPKNSGKRPGYHVFVIHLSMSDCLMGVYLIIVGIADQLYQNNYLWEDIKWRNSAVCQMAGFLALLSNEMSAFIICLITLDRFLVIRFPFSHLRFQFKSAHLICSIHWIIAIFLVSIPFFPSNTHWQFYSQTSICIPLPVTRSTFAGHSYRFGVMIGLNMILFLVTAAGQTAIYFAMKSSSMATANSDRKRRDLNIARRLITVAATDFLCWFPIGVLGCLASAGTPVPGEVNVAMATLVMPVNSAMNPFLYTMNIVLEKRRQDKEEKIVKHLKAT